MNKKKFLLLFLIVTILPGCGNTNEIVDYPSNSQGNSGTQENSEAVPDNVDGQTLNYVIINNDGSSSYEVNATVKGNVDETYPVYETLPADFTEEEMKQYCENIFDEGSISVIIPYFLSQSDYLERRREILTSRKKSYEDKGEAVPLYIDEDLKALEERQQSQNLNAVYTIPDTNEIKWNDMHDFYVSELDSDAECQYCYVEGTIDGEYYRANFLNYLNNSVFTLFKLNYYAEIPCTYYILKDEEHMPFDKNACAMTAEEATAKVESFIDKIGISGYNSIATYPACIDNTDWIEYEHNPTKVVSGYACYFAREVNGKTRPFNSLIDDSVTIVPYSNYLLSIPNYEEWGIYSPLEIGEGSGLYREGYEYLRVLITNEGIEQFFWNGPSKVGDITTDKAELLDFKEIDNRAQTYLKYYADNFGDKDLYTKPVIDLVELKMCRVTDDDEHYYMVPAWYYYLASDTLQVTKKSIVCVNAIDGSIIDVEAGGNTINIQ